MIQRRLIQILSQSTVIFRICPLSRKSTSIAILPFIFYITESWNPSRAEKAMAAITRNHRLRGLNNQNVFAHKSGSWKSKIKLSACLVSSDDSLLSLQVSSHSPSSVYAPPWSPGVSQFLLLFFFSFFWPATLFPFKNSQGAPSLYSKKHIFLTGRPDWAMQCVLCLLCSANPK